jgi:peptidoglycan/xylan/chitin deacetylase (PgdA/CDA1 family)
MRAGAAAVLSTVVMVGALANANACDRPGALGTSRVLKVNPDITAGFGRPFPAIPLSEGEIVLTFDDGPAPNSTPQILDILARECLRATFFMIGKRADSSPKIVVRARDGGHTLGSHSYSHRNLDTLPFEQAAEDIRRGFEAVERAAFGPGSGGARARLFRFPQYKSTPELVSFIRNHKGAVAGPDISSEDWRGQPPELTMERVRRLLDRRNRGMLSLHDNQKNTVAVLPMVIGEIRARGMRVVHIVAE